MSKASGNHETRHLVVALKYRPQSFDRLVGQDHIATALGNAIRQNRVGHAYLFTGARGVGKTSSARIFAKCLNCESGPTPTPCERCEACQAISVGEDVDVIEIDGASNRGIDEIRQLRANASVRPSRSKYKVYIIDEVHMLTKEAFNALLKTLEEPPPHVKFIFCTTDPEKIPITVLSRCQRFDFSPVQTAEIGERLRWIAEQEGVGIDAAAIALLARRANGSMRDSQSLLEQMLSFSDGQITVDDVHRLLGTADISRIAALASAVVQQNAGQALALIHEAIVDGVDAGQLTSQLLGYFRDMLAMRVGCDQETLLSCASPDVPELKGLAEQLGLETMLSVLQVLDGALVRMQASHHPRTLLEVACVRLCHLEHLDSMADLIASLSGAASGKGGARPVQPSGRPRVALQQVAVPQPDAASKKNEITKPPPVPKSPVEVPQTAPLVPAPPADPPPASADAVGEPVDQKTEHVDRPPPGAGKDGSKTDPFSVCHVETVWRKVLAQMGDMTADMAANFEKIEVREPDQLVVTLSDKVHCEFCSKPERRQSFEVALEKELGKRIRVDFLFSPAATVSHVPQPKLTRVQQIRKLEEDELVRQAMALFDAEITGFHPPRNKPPR